MNVAYFSNQFTSSEGHGIAHYAHRLYEHLIAAPDLCVKPVATWSNLPNQKLDTLLLQTGLRILPWGRRLTPLCWTFLNYPPIERWFESPIDITHMLAPGFPVATRAKLVVTVHDLGPVLYPEFFSDSKPWLFKRAMNQVVKQADAIICVSQSTANDLLNTYGSSLESRVHVALEGVDRSFFGAEEGGQLTSLPSGESPFFLAAGAMSPRKNLSRVLSAFEKLLSEIPHHLILVGGGGWDSQDVSKQLSNPVFQGRVHHLGYVSDDELRALYQYAEFYVHPSLYEGFGLTVLEAMAAGCPVITSNLSSLPEVAGDAAIFVDPHSEEDIGQAIKLLATDCDLRDSLIPKGYLQSSKFTWSSCADTVTGIYRSI